jgi:LysM repeat protein
MNMVGRLLRSLSALVVLVAVVVGAPMALWVLGRGLLPAGMPSLGEFWEGLTTRDTGGVFLGLLVVVGFIAWAVFTVCVVLEIAALLIGRRRAWRIPLLRVPQSAATALISVILTGTVMLGGASAAIAQAPSQDLHQSLSAGIAATAEASPVRVLAAAPEQAATAAPPTAATAAQVPAAGPVWTVARYDTFWGIADKTLGDGRRYQEIVELNVGVTQADGRAVQDSSTNLEIGWQLRLPADAAAPPVAPVASVDQVTVQQGDTLSGIAQQQLGDAARYPELATLNGISNADLINPGQVIRISGPAATPDPVTITPPAAAGAAAEDAGQNQTQSPTAAAAPAAADAVGQNQPPAAGRAAPTAEAPLERTPPAAPTTGPVGQNEAQTPALQEPAIVPSTASAESVTGDGEDRDHAAVAPAAVGMGVSAVLAAAVWWGLLAARRRKGRRRPSGKQPVMVSLPAARVERRIRERASARDVMWMDNALRYAAALAAGRDATDLPDVTCVWLSDTELQLQLAAPATAPAPFTAEGDSWVLPVTAAIPEPGEEDWADPAAPFPLLTSVGELDGETLLVDFERLGAVSVTGDADRTRDLLTHIAVELANNAWSDHLQVTLVGWGPELVALNPDRVRYLPTVGEVVRVVRGRIGETREVMADLQTTVLADRVVDPGAGDWSPEVWLIDAAAAAGDLQALEQVLAGVAAAGRSTVAVIARAEGFAPAGGAVINVDADGILSLPVLLGEQRVHAAGMDPEALGRLLELFECAGQFEQPGPMPGTDSWARGMSTAGSLIPEELVVAADPVRSVDDPPVVDGAGEFAEDDDQEIGQKSGQVLPLRVGPSTAAAAALAATLADDPELDYDLAEWFDPVPRRPRVSVLGPPLVVANGVMPTGRPVRMTEIAIYLGTHREVDADKFVTDLWAEDATIKAVSRRSDISRVRTWLGVDEDGRKYLPEARSKPYRMTRLLDLELFRRLRKRADARAGAGDPVGAQRDLLSALMLVRGPVMAGASRDAYTWLVTSDPAGVLQAPLTVIATAHQLVDSALADDDLDLARLAADIGHRVDPAEDQPLCDLLRISHRAGDDLDARSWAQLLLQTNGVESPEDLPNLDSYLTVHEVFPRGLRTAAAAASG